MAITEINEGGVLMKIHGREYKTYNGNLRKKYKEENAAMDRAIDRLEEQLYHATERREINEIEFHLNLMKGAREDGQKKLDALGDWFK